MYPTQREASPPPSFVAQSLTDTLSKPQRTLSRVNAIPGSVHSNRTGPRPSHSHSNSYTGSIQSYQEKKDAARKAAAAMCEQLGIPTPATDEEASLNLETPKPSARTLKAGAPTTDRDELKDEKDEELSRLRKQVGNLLKDNSDLTEKCSRYEKEKTKNPSTNSLNSVQLQDLEKTFASQESLLAGYQRDAEKSFATIDNLKRQQARYVQLLTKTFGANFESELFTEQGIPLPSAGSNFASPAIRTKLGHRQSIAPTGTPITNKLALTEFDQINSAEETNRNPTNSSENPNLSPAAMHEHLEAVQTLLKRMQQRILSRDGELAQTEQRAKQEANKARARAKELESLMKNLQPSLRI